MDTDPASSADRRTQSYILAAIFVEFIFYGAYVVLYAVALYLMTRRKSIYNDSWGARMFFIAINVMFIQATLHICVNFYRGIRAYGEVVFETPINYFEQNYTSWDNLSHIVMFGNMLWFGDALVIYRCYVVWNRNIWIIALPLLLLAYSVVLNLVLYAWWELDFASPEEMHPVISTGYPLAFIQNFLTTGLITYKLWAQYRESVKAGVIAYGGPVRIITVMRIVIESAALYTVELMVIIPLFFVNHPAQFVIQSALVPSVGIIFVLMAIRLHLAQQEEILRNNGIQSVIPPWFSNDPRLQQTSTHNGDGVDPELSLEVLSTATTKPPQLVNRASEATLNRKADEAGGSLGEV
ncbi:hypothetical protein CC1G_10797 [Coprinopsis cinerea okayama7|uniref:Integral membrane protein n=1 Tax=Coprinopsis cinerea (strain Okayama-7 / 130 / ATCC MYA-4618 / FGSC 9003) TaxID=240176 RepID=A8NMI5_COPC7|nr:hypothetical protein CC1G_10797 [Coprinopsis cinerea okayama7\|eukprot:XP_001834923.2 hypothetical protein CC1G_10797 [Coprinopsis cinerea okayama7\